MKKIGIITALFFLVCIGCFEDKGNYSYESVVEPTWKTDYISISCYEGDTAKFVGSDKFEWPAGNENRAEEVRYEWKINGVVVGEELDFEILTDSLIKKIGLTKFEENGLAGSFSIIDEKSEVRFMVRTYNQINPKYYNGDWVVLSQQGEDSKLSFLKSVISYDKSGTAVYSFELTDNIFETINGETIIGKPIALSKGRAKNIGSLGSMTIMTDKVAWVVDNTNLKKVSELKDEFLDGTPENFIPVALHNSDDASAGGITLVATMDGRLFKRQMSENYLGGKFLTEPYALDEKGYDIVDFGLCGAGWKDLPMYDKKNRRVVFMNCQYDYTLGYVVKLEAVTPNLTGESENVAPVWNMPEGTDVLFIGYQELISLPYGSGQMAYTIIYNDVNGETYLADFVINGKTIECVSNEDSQIIRFPGGDLTKESMLLTSIFDYDAKYLFLYSKANEIYCLDRRDGRNEVSCLLSLDSKVTFLGYTMMRNAYKRIVVGCENGDLLVYDISNRQSPLCVAKWNLGGKVVDAKELGNLYSFDEVY